MEVGVGGCRWVLAGVVGFEGAKNLQIVKWLTREHATFRNGTEGAIAAIILKWWSGTHGGTFLIPARPSITSYQLQTPTTGRSKNDIRKEQARYQPVVTLLRSDSCSEALTFVVCELVAR